MNYIVLSELGHGGMASVYLANHKNLGTDFAIKILDKRFISDDNIRKRFLSEARIMSRMNHPNIVRVSDLIDETETVAFVMEYVPGETLKQYIDRVGKLGEQDVKSLFNQMLSATKYIHDQGLIHRDIKPSNFMVTPEGQIKLMDFGIAKINDASSSEYTGTGTSQQMGTPMYMSPEQVRATGSVTKATDTYSLGVTLWQMVSGTKPYDTASLSLPEIQVSILREDLPLTGTIWDPVIQKATRKNPEERFENDTAFNDAISNPALAAPTPAPLPETPAPLTSEIKNHESASPSIPPYEPKKKKNLVPVLLTVVVVIGLVIVASVMNRESDTAIENVEFTPDPTTASFDQTEIDSTSTTEVVPDYELESDLQSDAMSQEEKERKRLEREERKQQKEYERQQREAEEEWRNDTYSSKLVNCSKPGCRIKTPYDHETSLKPPYKAYCSMQCYNEDNSEEIE